MGVFLVNSEAHNLSRTLQNKSLSAAEGQQVAQMTIQTIKSVCSDESFDLFWEKLDDTAKSLDISGPQLPRQRKQPKRYDDGLSAGDVHQNPKDYY